MPVANRELVESFLLPYDGSIAVQAVPSLGADFLIPSIRCAEDRRRAGAVLLAPLANVPVEDSNHDAFDVPGPVAPERAHSPQGMYENALRTGISIVGGRAALILAQTTSNVMKNIPPRLLPTMSFLDLVIGNVSPAFGENHEHCTGRENMRVISQFAVEHPNQIQKTAQLIAPDLDVAPLLSRYVDATEQLLADDTVLPHPSDQAISPLRVLERDTQDPSIPVQHAAKYITAIGATTGEQVLFDTDKAWESGYPGFAMNTGFIPLVTRLTTRTLGGNSDYATAALVYYQAAAVHLLPHPEEGQQHVIHYFGREDVS